MKKITGHPNEKGFGRRAFLKLSGASVMLSYLASNVKSAFGYGSSVSTSEITKKYWYGPEDKIDEQYCIQDTVDDSQADQGYIWAMVDGWWRKFAIQELDNGFREWNLNERVQVLEQVREGKLPVGGPILPTVASYGNRRGRLDSRFHLNCAVKGMELCPKKEYAQDIIANLKETWNAPYDTKLDYLEEIYSNRDLWSWDRHLSAEMFTTPLFETHSFLNQMENPISTLSFLSTTTLTHYEVRSIVRLIHPLDPNVSEEEKEFISFSAYTHDYFHGGSDEGKLIRAIYYHIEEFDNTPGQYPGQKVVPD